MLTTSIIGHHWLMQGLVCLVTSTCRHIPFGRAWLIRWPFGMCLQVLLLLPFPCLKRVVKTSARWVDLVAEKSDPSYLGNPSWDCVTIQVVTHSWDFNVAKFITAQSEYVLISDL